MAKHVQIVGGSTSFLASYAGFARELTFDTDRNELLLHTGAGVGTGKRIPNKDTNDTLYQGLSALLTAYAALTATGGFVAKTSANAVAARTLTAVANQTAITNGTGASADPTIGLASAIILPGSLTSGTGTVQLDTLKGTLLGTLTGADQLIDGAKFKDESFSVNALGSVSGATSINYTLGSYVTCTVTGNTTFSVTNPPATGTAGEIVMEITNGGAGTITWPTGTKWPGGVAPVLQASGVDVVVLYTRDAATTFRGALSQSASA